MIDTYIKSVSWCPIHRMHVVILVDRNKTKWLPVFIKPNDADIIESALSEERSHIPQFEGEILKITLATERTNPYYAIVTVKQGNKLLKKKMYYATAIVIAIRLKFPIRIPEEKMLDLQTEKSDTMVRREDVRTALKERLARPTKPKTALEHLKKQLRDAIENEKYEEADIITKEIEILKDKYSK